MKGIKERKGMNEKGTGRGKDRKEKGECGIGREGKKKERKD